MNTGDALARGAKSASFTASEKNISQEKWDAIWREDEPKEKKSEPAKEEIEAT